MPDSNRYKTDSNLRQILLILCTYTLPTHEHSAPLELFLQSLAKELLCVAQQNQLFSVLQLNGFLFPGGAGKGNPVERNWSLGRTDTKPIQDRYES